MDLCVTVVLFQCNLSFQTVLKCMLNLCGETQVGDINCKLVIEREPCKFFLLYQAAMKLLHDSLI